LACWAQPTQLTRKIAAVHVHHTWRPRRQDFRGLATVEAMRKFHMEQNGWSDLAQHLTIDPQGGLWTGRNWNLAPASATGHNGTAGEGPFMIEMVGDFDAGQDPFDGEQRTAAIETVAHLVRAFGLQDADVKFHNQLTNRALGARQDNPRPPRQRRGRSRPMRKRFQSLSLLRRQNQRNLWPSLSHARLLVREYDWAAPFVSLFTVTGH
jgi:hypothetical protein